MSNQRIAAFAQAIEIWESTVDPNGTVAPIGLGALCAVNVAGSVAWWVCTALPSTWVELVTSLTNIPLSDIEAATATNSIDNTLYAQTWAWSTLTTQTAWTLGAAALTSGKVLTVDSSSVAATGELLSVTSASTAAFTAGGVRLSATGAHTGSWLRIDDATVSGTVVDINAPALTTGTGMDIDADALTTGSILDISSASLALNSTNGLLRVANTTAGVAGVLARFQANSGANSGVTMTCSGRTGFGTATPGATLHVGGTLALAMGTAGDYAAGGAIGAAAITVDILSGWIVAQTTAGQTLTVPNPTAPVVGQQFWLVNASGSTQAFTYGAVAFGPGRSIVLTWDGAAWAYTV